MHRRRNPYSCIEELQRSRNEVLGLLLVTVMLGMLLGLFTDGLVALLQSWLPAHLWPLALGGIGLLTLILVVIVGWLFCGRVESRRARISLWLPYHLPRLQQATIAVTSAYAPLHHARRIFMRRYPAGSPALQDFLTAYASAKQAEQLFQKFIAADQLALSQCLVLYIIHHYAARSLGYEASYSWWKVPLATQRLTLDELPPVVTKNSFLRADQQPNWRLLLPQDVTFEATNHRWVLRHRHYGEVSIRWHPRFPVAGTHSQPYRACAERLRLHGDSELHVIGTRLEAVARLRYALWPAGEPFQEWATGLLARLEEFLDYDYYLAALPHQIIRELEWKVGWVPTGSSLVEMLQVLTTRLEELELSIAGQCLPNVEEEPIEDFVV